MSLPSSFIKRTYAHPWRTARNQSVLDTVFLVVLGAVVFSLPLEGVLISEGSRTFTFYFSIIAVGVAAFRLPILIRNLLRTPPMLVYIGVFLLGILLFYIRPFRETNSDINVIVQLVILSTMFIYLADQPKARQQILWVYWFGWTLFVIISMFEVLGGAATNTMGAPDSEVVRLKILNYSIASHSGHVGAGLMLALSLAMTTRSLWLRLAVVASIAVGSLTLLFGGTRGALLAVVASVGLWLVINRFVKVKPSKPTSSSVTKAVTFITIIVTVFLILTQTQIGVELLDSMGVRLNQTIEEGDLSSRDVIYEAAISIFHDNPMGVGYGNAQPLIGRRLNGLERNPHNDYLRMFIETGVIGGGLFILSLVFITRRGLRWYLRSQESLLFPMIFLLFYAATVSGFGYKTTWFFVTMNALTPLDNPEYREELAAEEAT